MPQHASFLLDTNVISHLIRPKRELHAGIARFFETVEEDRLYLSTITVGEIQKGIDLIPWPAAGTPEHEARLRLQAQLEQRLEALCDRFNGRLVAPDVRVVRQWGRFHAEAQRRGRKTPVVDTLIAASAYVHRLIIATADGDFAAFHEHVATYDPQKQSILGHWPR